MKPGGDGYTQQGIEECNYSNTLDGDGCNSSCKTEKSKETPPCSPGDTLLHVRFVGDHWAHYDNSL